VSGGQALGGLAANAEYVGQRQRALFRLPQKLGERPPFEELHRQEWHAPVFADLVDRHDVIVVNRGSELRFAQETLAR
jgi:hypothetical protein